MVQGEADDGEQFINYFIAFSKCQEMTTIDPRPALTCFVNQFIEEDRRQEFLFQHMEVDTLFSGNSIDICYFSSASFSLPFFMILCWLSGLVNVAFFDFVHPKFKTIVTYEGCCEEGWTNERDDNSISHVYVNFRRNYDNLRALVMQYFEEAAAGAEGEYHCGQCHDEKRVTTRRVLTVAPDVLVVHLRRIVSAFELGGRRAKKINRAIKVGGNLTLKSHDSQKSTYTLIASSIHSGMSYEICMIMLVTLYYHLSGQMLNSGHYTTCIKWNERYFIFDDNRPVRPASQRDVERGELFVYVKIKSRRSL